jgi:hypothetical protein
MTGNIQNGWKWVIIGCDFPRAGSICPMPSREAYDEVTASVAGNARGGSRTDVFLSMSVVGRAFAYLGAAPKLCFSSSRCLDARVTNTPSSHDSAHYREINVLI